MSKNVPASSAHIAPHLDALLDSIEDGVFIADRDGTTLLVNAAYERLTGLAKAELIGKNVLDLKKEGLFHVDPIAPEIVATGKSASSVQVTRDNLSVALDGRPIRDEAGRVRLVAVYARDVTLMARMREQIAAQQELIERYQRRMDSLLREDAPSPEPVAENPAMKRVKELLRRVAATDAVALLLGETGVGKELFARKIHEASPRRDKTFIKVDCATIPENLIESELFGYVAGAFSGAHPKGRVGFFEMADGGSIFLDEIGELPLSVQAKLLRVLQDRELTPLGSSLARKVDVRVIAATNRDLEADVRAGLFRGDLFFRLRVAVLEIPALRDRPDDILPLARLFLDRFGTSYRKRTRLSPAVEALFSRYNWPGNVRELENLIEGLVITGDKEVVEAHDLPAAMRSKTFPIGPGAPAAPVDDGFDAPLRQVVAAFERDYLQAAIRRHGSVGQAAKHLGLDRTTIFRKLRRGQAD